MNMHVDSKRIRAERERRAWSQEHLASVAGVSLRTIQRVEGTGLASYDTAQALSAVLCIDIAELRMAAPVRAPVPAAVPSERAAVVPLVAAPAYVVPPEADARLPRRRYWGTAASLTLMLAAALFGGRVAYAQQVQLDVGLGINDQDLGAHTLITGAGRDAEIRLEGRLKLVVVPTVATDGNISLAIRMYEYADDRFTLVSEPKLLAADNDEVELRLTSKRGNVFRVAIKPHRVDPGAPPPG
jgi:transcriptional regulator with XRE-family HTH domain